MSYEVIFNQTICAFSFLNWKHEKEFRVVELPELFPIDFLVLKQEIEKRYAFAQMNEVEVIEASTSSTVLRRFENLETAKNFAYKLNCHCVVSSSKSSKVWVY